MLSELTVGDVLDDDSDVTEERRDEVTSTLMSASTRPSGTRMEPVCSGGRLSNWKET